MESNKNEIVKVNREEFIAKYEPMRMVTEFRNVKSLPDAIQADPNGISFYSKHLGEDTILAVIELHLVSLNASVNVNNPLSKMQIKEIAIEIMAMYYYLNMVEIQYVFRRAKRGEYGQLYGSLSMVNILSWFSQYAEERANHYINLHTRDITRDHSMRSEEREIWARHERLINKNREDGE